MAASAKRKGGGLLTLTEVAVKTGISMPTLQRYKKLYQDRIPSEGEGRRQRYHPSALKVFEEIKKENIGKRGRPRKSASGGAKAARGTVKRGRKAGTGGGRGRKAASAASDSGLLSLAEIGKRTGISYPTLSRYVKLHGPKLKHEGTGRKRRFYPEAVEVFQELRRSSTRGPKKAARGGKRGGRRKTAAAASGTNAALAARVQALEKKIQSLEKRLGKTLRVVIPAR